VSLEAITRKKRNEMMFKGTGDEKTFKQAEKVTLNANYMHQLRY
jgi:hypothetical protein